MKETTTKEKGCAKINLALHVTGVKENGYHFLDSIVIFPDIFDSLSFKKGRKTMLTFTGEFSRSLNVKKNSVIQALNLFENLLTDHFSINLEKNLPLGAGLGGGSADAAAVIRFISNYCRHPMPSPEAISKIGADVPVCVLSLASRVRGIGEITTPIDIAGINLWIVLVNPRIFVATGIVFKEVIEKHNEPLEPFTHFRKTDQFIDYLKRQRNDLQSIAVNKWPEIKEVLDTIEKTQDVLLSRMSGSGSTCFGLYRTQDIAKRAVSYLKQKSKKWWVKYSKVN
ncbi:4-(cytidine 5'-diphospho)-2-C-methyl-D-erythritol kinase [Paracoccaceae bacterium]|nr:4-(cytidine 5'-diphospho)-2-C-methyl-D-erythritol kinase [Paracoccaceae bacterium]